jgi:hypothetical protein
LGGIQKKVRRGAGRSARGPRLQALGFPEKHKNRLSATAVQAVRIRVFLPVFRFHPTLQTMQKDYNLSIKPVKEKLARPLSFSLPLPALAPSRNPATIKPTQPRR